MRNPKGVANSKPQNETMDDNVMQIVTKVTNHEWCRMSNNVSTGFCFVTPVEVKARSKISHVATWRMWVGSHTMSMFRFHQTVWHCCGRFVHSVCLQRLLSIIAITFLQILTRLKVKRSMF